MDDYREPLDPTYYQMEALRQLLPPDTPILHLNRLEAARLIRLKNPQALWRDKPVSDKQEVFLKRYGLWKEGMNRGQAAAVIEEACRKDRDWPGYLSRLEQQAIDRRLELSRQAIQKPV